MAAADHDHAREEFLAEAQELVEGLSRDVLQLEQEQRDGQGSPELLNDLFRSVHTLKGLSGMFDYRELGRLAHVLEDLLEQLRMDRVRVTPSVLDLLFQGVEGFARLLAARGTGAPGATLDIEQFATRVHGLTQHGSAPRASLSDYALDPGTLAVLTEYEEHRLRTWVERGHALYRLELELPIETIETALDELKQRAQQLAEIVSMLPSQGQQRDGVIGLVLLIASAASPADVESALSPAGGKLTPIARRAAPPAPAVPTVQQGEPLRSAPTSSAPPEAGVLARAGEGERRGDQLSLRSLTSVVRVDIRKLDHLMNAVGELGTVRNAVGKLLDKLRAGASRAELVLEAQRVHRTFDRRLGVVQDAVLEVRMVPLSQLFDKLAVVVRQLGREQGKYVQLVVRGAETEVDKLIAEEVADPLVHLMRNAVDHGLEVASERADRDKSAVGSVSIHAYQKGNHVVLDVKDDGRGIDPAVVQSVAIERRLLSPERAAGMTERETLELIFLPGFSTTAAVSDVSGRGVGMDVVRTNVQRLGGSVEVASVLGQGTTLSITLPITLAIIAALIFRVRGRTMALPLAVVSEVVKIDARAVRTIEGREVLDLRGATLPLCRLGELLRLSAADAASPEQHAIMVLVGNRRLALVVDRLLSQQDVVIKALGPSLRNVRGIAGATDLGDQQLVLVLDAASVLDEVLAQKSARLQPGHAGGQA
jgi:two-component system chemotaxis sensor kinase CheA